jgi:hypothetical protein
LVEVPVEDRAPVIRDYGLRARRRPGSAAVALEARAFYGVGPGLAIEVINTVADRFPGLPRGPGPRRRRALSHLDPP